MSERSKQADDPVRDEVAAVVGRARAAARAIENYSQEQVDELVTAVAWAVVRKDRAEALARLAVDRWPPPNHLSPARGEGFITELAAKAVN